MFRFLRGMLLDGGGGTPQGDNQPAPAAPVAAVPPPSVVEFPPRVPAPPAPDQPIDVAVQPELAPAPATPPVSDPAKAAPEGFDVETYKEGHRTFMEFLDTEFPGVTETYYAETGIDPPDPVAPAQPAPTGQVPDLNKVETPPAPAPPAAPAQGDFDPFNREQQIDLVSRAAEKAAETVLARKEASDKVRVHNDTLLREKGQVQMHLRKYTKHVPDEVMNEALNVVATYRINTKVPGGWRGVGSALVREINSQLQSRGLLNIAKEAEVAAVQKGKETVLAEAPRGGGAPTTEQPLSPWAQDLQNMQSAVGASNVSLLDQMLDQPVAAPGFPAPEQK